MKHQQLSEQKSSDFQAFFGFFDFSLISRGNQTRARAGRLFAKAFCSKGFGSFLASPPWAAGL